MPNYQLQNGKKRVICGHLGKDPELRQLKSTQVARFSVAVGQRQQVTDEDGKKRWVDQAPEWFSCKAFGSLAEVAMCHFHKGDSVMLAGHDEPWTGRDGRIFTDLVCEVIAIPVEAKQREKVQVEEDEDIPF